VKYETLREPCALPRGAVVRLEPGVRSETSVGDRAIAKIFVVRIRVVSLTNRREHWTNRHKRNAEHRFIVGATVGNRILGLVPCIVTLTRLGQRRLDGDNLQGALKSVRDAVSDALGVDDGDARIEWRYAQQPGATREYAVRIEVRPKT
jgi:hypothetical protein